jgi:hypothetical protein
MHTQRLLQGTTAHNRSSQHKSSTSLQHQLLLSKDKALPWPVM